MCESPYVALCPAQPNLWHLHRTFLSYNSLLSLGLFSPQTLRLHLCEEIILIRGSHNNAIIVLSMWRWLFNDNWSCNSIRPNPPFWRVVIHRPILLHLFCAVPPATNCAHQVPWVLFPTTRTDVLQYPVEIKHLSFKALSRWQRVNVYKCLKSTAHAGLSFRYFGKRRKVTPSK